MTSIQWTDRVWNPISGCTKVSKGCQHCYAERQADRKLPKGGFTDRPFTEVRCHPNRLDIPLHWRKPQRVFVNSMSDLFHEDVPDEFIDKVFAVMALCPQHTFQVLTKRPERMRRYATDAHTKKRGIVHNSGVKQFGRVVTDELLAAIDSGFPNLWLGVSVEDQATADERIPLLLQTPAALRWVSYEPALGPVDFTPYLWGKNERVDSICQNCPRDCDCECGYHTRRDLKLPTLDWIVVGGESGSGARPFDVAWARSTVEQCQAAEVPVFVKQLGARPEHRVQRPNSDGYGGDHGPGWTSAMGPLRLVDRKGGDIEEWPTDLRVREWPEVPSCTSF